MKKNFIMITLTTVIILCSLSTFANKQLLNTKKSKIIKNNKPPNNIEELPTMTPKKKSLSEKEFKEREIEILETAIVSNIGNYKNNVAIYYENLKTGTTYSLNDHKYFTGASIRKLGNVMATADLIDNGTLNKDLLINYNPTSDYEGGTGILQNQNKILPITVEKAIELAIVHSDNIATKMLSKIGGWASPYYEKITGSPAKNGTLTANQVGILLKRLYKNTDENPIYTDIINHLKNTVFHDRLDKYLPHNKVAHKIGSNYKYYHDAGIIYGDTHDYILVILTENIGDTPISNGEKMPTTFGDNNVASCELIANISKDIFSEFLTLNYN